MSVERERDNQQNDLTINIACWREKDDDSSCDLDISYTWYANGIVGMFVDHKLDGPFVH